MTLREKFYLHRARRNKSIKNKFVFCKEPIPFDEFFIDDYKVVHLFNIYPNYCNRFDYLLGSDILGWDGIFTWKDSKIEKIFNFSNEHDPNMLIYGFRSNHNNVLQVLYIRNPIIE